MDDPDKTLISGRPRRENPKTPTSRYRPIQTDAEKKQEEFRRGQSKILQRLAANAPLSEILERLGASDRSTVAGHALFGVTPQ